MQRYARQTRLPEIGAGGQARIRGSRMAVLVDGFAGDIAARYLAGAGVGHLDVRDGALLARVKAVDPSIGAHVDPGLAIVDDERDFGLRDEAPRALARGAHAALSALRMVIEASQ